MYSERQRKILSQHSLHGEAFWKTLNYRDITPRDNPEVTAPQFIHDTVLRHGNEMEWYDIATFIPLTYIARGMNKFNRSSIGKKMRKALHQELPSASDVVVNTDNGPEQHNPTVWELEVASYSPEDAEVQFRSEGSYKKFAYDVPVTLLAGVASGVFTRNENTYNGLFNCVRDDTSPSLIKFRNIRNPDLKCSAAVVLPNGQVKVMQMYDRPWSWQEIHNELVSDHFGYDSMTIEDLEKDDESDIQIVIDCSNESVRRGKPAYCLSRTATTSITYDPETGETFGSYIHGVADGTAVQTFFMQTFYDLERHYSGKLEREHIQMPGTTYEEFTYLSKRKDTVQMIGMENMPRLKFADLITTNLIARSNNPETQHQRSVTFTATNNYPRPLSREYRENTGSEPPMEPHLFDLNAALENRIGIGQEQWARHAHLITTFQQIMECVKAHYGGNWISEIRTMFPAAVLHMIPRELIENFKRLRKQSLITIDSEIKAAREDKSLPAQTMNLFHGRDISWGAAKFAQLILRDEFVGDLNGSLLSQMVIDEGMVRGKDSPSIWFRTVTPDRNHSQLTILRRKVMTNKEFFKKNYRQFQLDMDRDPLTLERVTHLVSWKDDNPYEARRKAEIHLHNLYEAWILMDLLVNN